MTSTKRPRTSFKESIKSIIKEYVDNDYMYAVSDDIWNMLQEQHESTLEYRAYVEGMLKAKAKMERLQQLTDFIIISDFLHRTQKK